MDILEKIIAYKKAELEVRKLLVTEEELMQSRLFNSTVISLKQRLDEGIATGIIAEFKRRSPSKGFFNRDADVAKVTTAYTKYGAAGLSVQTDHHFFAGNTEDFIIARENRIPILRRDFIIDKYQLVASKAMGADVVLLIAACMTATKLQELAAYAKNIGLETLLEIHADNELAYICDEIDMVNINNRSLKNFKVDTRLSVKLGKFIPLNITMIASSGITEVETIQRLKQLGYKGFLMGEIFMKEKDPGEAFKQFTEQLFAQSP